LCSLDRSQFVRNRFASGDNFQKVCAFRCLHSGVYVQKQSEATNARSAVPCGTRPN
jgi:hypothetical protein